MLGGKWAGMVLGVRSAIVSLSNAFTPPLAGIIADKIGYSAVFSTSLVIAFYLTPNSIW